jgi:hypothetical protein
MRITEYGSAQFDHLPGAGIEIINGEKELKVTSTAPAIDLVDSLGADHVEPS